MYISQLRSTNEVLPQISTEVAHSVRCRAVETSDLLQRATEENILIHSEMKSVVHFFLSQHNLLSQNLVRLASSSRYEHGLISFFTHRLALVEKKLFKIKTAFSAVGEEVCHLPHQYLILFDPIGVYQDMVTSSSESESGSEYDDNTESEVDSD